MEQGKSWRKALMHYQMWKMRGGHLIKYLAQSMRPGSAVQPAS